MTPRAKIEVFLRNGTRVDVFFMDDEPVTRMVECLKKGLQQPDGLVTLETNQPDAVPGSLSCVIQYIPAREISHFAVATIKQASHAL